MTKFTIPGIVLNASTIGLGTSSFGSGIDISTSMDIMDRWIQLGGQKDPDGLEWKNPVVVAIGDSVTAGHFESLLPADPQALQEMMEVAQAQAEKGEPLPPIEVTDARECFIEGFRCKLIDKYEQTSVSVINAGIAGDTGTAERSEKIREVAEERRVCLVDVHRIWEEARDKGCPWEELLSNGVNHPSVEGHEVYAIALMKLFEEVI